MPSAITTTYRRRSPVQYNNPLVALFLKPILLEVGNAGPYHLWDVPINTRVLFGALVVTVAGVHGASTCTARLVLCDRADTAPAVGTDIITRDAETTGVTHLTASGDKAADTNQVIALYLSNAPDTTAPTVGCYLLLDRDDLKDL